MGNFIAGTASEKINPKIGLELAGYPHEPRNNKGVHDDLLVSCLYLKNDSTELVLTSFDLCYFSKEIASAIRKAVAEDTGLLKENIILSCTHTHSAPWTAARLDYESIVNNLDYDHEYVEMVKKVTVKTIKLAIGSAFSAKVGLGVGRCGKESGIGGNRRDPAGVVDDQLPVIAIKDLNGNIRSLLVKYAVHPTMLHADNFLVSSDYIGYVRNYLQDKYPSSTVLFHQGTSGDQSPRYFRSGQTFEEAERMGVTIAQEAIRVVSEIIFSSEIKLNVATDEIIPVLKKLPDLQEAIRNVSVEKANFQAMRVANTMYTDLRTQELAVFGAENAYGYALQQEKYGCVPFAQNELPIEITAVSVGESRILFMPGEMFATFGLLISRSSKNRTWVVTLSNGFMPGYCCTKEAYEEGGYEAGTSLLRPETGDLIVGAALRLLQKME